MVGPTTPDKRLLWHPQQRNKFVVGGGSQITLYEWAAESQEIRHVTSQHDLQFMKTFAWSPDPAFDDLVAVGLSTGRIDLLRLEASRHTRKTLAGSSVLSGGPIVSLMPRSSRACNSLDFCRVDPNFLAVGLDKVRGDSSLVIYDIISARSKLSLSLSLDDDSSSLVPPARPGPTIPRFEITPRADQRTVQHHAPTEVVTAVSYASNTNHLVLAGMSHRWLRLLDIRTATPTVTSVAARVQGITSDPFDTHRIATFGDGMVSVWDVRKLTGGPLLAFTDKDASADGFGLQRSPLMVYSGIEFSPTRRGTIATLHQNSSYVRFWDTLATNARSNSSEGGGGASGSSDGGVGESSSLSSRLTRKSWTGLPWTAAAPTTPMGGSQASARESTPLVLSDTRRTKLFPKSLSSFALVPSDRASLTSNIMVVNKDGDLELYALHDTPKQAVWSGRGDFVISAGKTCRIFSGVMEGEAELEQEFLQQRDQHSQAQQPQQLDSNERERSRSMATETTESVHSMSFSRGRSVTSPFGMPPPLFGRGDEDGFPALGTVFPPTRSARESPVFRTGISATRPNSASRARTYSPASMRRYPIESATTLKTKSKSRSRSGARLAGLTSTTQTATDEAKPPAALAPPARARKLSRGAGRSDSRNRDIAHIVEDDISMVMRRRCLRGYGIGTPYHNVAVTRDDDAPVPRMLSDLWRWMNHAQDFLCVPTPRLHGYDFAYSGVIGIWEGLLPVGENTTSSSFSLSATNTPTIEPLSLLSDIRDRSRSRPRRSHSLTATGRNYSPADDLHGNFHAALTALAMRFGDGNSGVNNFSGLSSTGRSTGIATSRPLQRQVALHLCGWSLKEEDLWTNVKRWEKEGSHSRAACWLVFAQHYSKAFEVLMRSNDESHHMMSGVLAALTANSSSRNADLREHYERLIIRLQDPYFRVMLTHLSSGDWSEVLDEEVIPFRERLAIAFQFLDDNTLTSYLRRCIRDSAQRGDIDGLMVTGLTKAGLDILQSYVNRSGDVQTAAILASYVCPPKFRDPRADRWIEAYRDLLDGFKLHHHRVWFDVERGGLLGEAGTPVAVDWAPRQIVMRCNYCNKPVVNPNASPRSVPKHKPTVCANCNRALPRCSVCLMTLSIVPDVVRDAELVYSPGKDTIEEAILICQTCRHGGHASHITEWFFGEGGERSRGLCPVAGCDCRCTDEF
ncbi:zinc-ribbon-16 domain-containing protein [Mycena indigotica]|uniref:Zinc-ribbon-16 domain-containing protein n=1 Tax=Mycena indigotica TaxID=2126181 RepID=A0A8H6SKW1_9AGAR|nr:zinc-ribbon-16 domain-containing protein [Mycena indigotica]KAF7301219.1 zinc-ribbon-16 domain-containing protein [Mycena indigotica]